MRRDADLDFLLTMALDIHDKDLLCPCGCGFYAEDTLDPMGPAFDVDDATICNARGAREEWEKEHGADTEPGTLIMLVNADEVEAKTQRLPGDKGLKPVDRTITDDAMG